MALIVSDLISRRAGGGGKGGNGRGRRVGMVQAGGRGVRAGLSRERRERPVA